MRRPILSSGRILIVEDDELVAEQLRRGLTAEGYEVVATANSGEEAIEQGEQTRPDLVLLDIMLSGSVDGISVAQKLQPLGIPVLYLTAYSDRQLLDRAQHTEPLGFMIKPASSRELAATIQMALFKRDQERARERERPAGWRQLAKPRNTVA